MPKIRTEGNLDQLHGKIVITLGKTSAEADEPVDVKAATARAKQGKRSFYRRILETAPAQTVNSLGMAGSVALTTAAIAQVDVAKNETELLVANLAVDHMAGAFEMPPFFEQYIDPVQAAAWGQNVLEGKIAEAREFIEETSESRIDETSDQGDNQADQSVENEQSATEDNSESEEGKEESVDGGEGGDDVSDKSATESVADEDEGTDDTVDEGEASEEDGEVSHTESKETGADGVKPTNTNLPKVVTPDDAEVISPNAPAS